MKTQKREPNEFQDLKIVKCRLSEFIRGIFKNGKRLLEDFKHLP